MRTYSSTKLRKAQAILALAIFILPTFAFSQGLKIDLLDGADCRLYCDSTRNGLILNRDSVRWLPAPNYLRTHHEIDNENRLLTSQSYYFSENDLNESGHYRVFGLSDAAISRSELRGRSDWAGTKRGSVGKATAGKQAGKGFLNFDIPIKFPKMLSSLVGEGGPGLSVTGNYKVLFKVDKNFTTGIARSTGVNTQGTPGFQTQQEYNMFITGNVGSKLFVNMKTDKRANIYNQRLDLADRIQIRYKGNDEDLVQSIEAGNTTLSLGGTQYAGFSQSVQGLFGLKAEGKLGGFNWTAITSQQKGSSQSKSFKAGAEATTVRLRDYEYLRYVYYDLGRKKIAKPDNNNGLPPFDDEFIIGQDTIVGNPEFFIADQSYNSNQSQLPHGRCFVNPPSFPDTLGTDSATAGETIGGFFNKISPDQYELKKDSFYVRFNYPLTSGDLIGVMMKVYKKSVDSIVEIGFPYWDPVDSGAHKIINLRYVMKLVKHTDAENNKYVSFYYAWKNVYDMRERKVNTDEFTVDIYEGERGHEADPSRKAFQDPGIRYLRLLGLDKVDNTTGTGAPDNKIDVNRTVVDLDRGYIIFPDRYPFNNKVSYTPTAGDTLAIKVPDIYNYGPSSSKAQGSSKYFIEILTKSRRTSFSLGQVDIMEHSEDVRLNGRQLQRDVDYKIDYQLGQIDFYNTQVTDPNADVQINYEYTPFLTAQKKNLFGFRSEYAAGDNFKVGSTVLYSSSSTIDRKPRIGEEPSHALLLDADFGYTGQSNLITRMVDMLPGVVAAAPSAFQLQGEIARSLPNPNTTGRAFIDDFEGSRDFFSLGVRRGIWTKSSAPGTLGQSSRGKLAWFTPDSKIYDPRNGNKPIVRFKVLEIFPARSVPSKDERTDVLELRYFPKQDSAGFADPNSWGGIMRTLGTSGLKDQQETQLLEFWVGLEEGKPVPKLHFDFGKISEDIDGDNKHDTEDPDRIKTLDPAKDVGLDGLADSSETGYSSTNLDPNGDDWIAPGKNINDPVDIDHINGTEKNGSDPDRPARPDNEDLNDNGLETDNNYFSFSVDLGDTTKFMVPGSYRSNADSIRPNESRLIHWRQIRIPLKDSSARDSIVGIPSWSNIENVRIWVNGVPDTSATRIIFASFDLVGNRWKELGVFDDTLKPVTDNSEKVQVSVINTQEHPAYRADPPPGVSEVLNRVTNLLEREQSLVLTYENLQPGNTGLIQRVLLGGAEDYSGYRTMKMLVHGDRRLGPADSLLFFFRFGSGTQNDPKNFYEYRARLKPGWDAENEVVLDFNRLTNLKNVLSKSSRPSGLVQDTIDGAYRVRGNPSLAAVRWYVMGVENQASLQAASGEVWADELLLSDVRRDAGTAGRFHLSTQLSDFGTINLEFSRKGATFRNLTGSESGTLSYNRSASTDEVLSWSGSFQGHKLLPNFLGVTALPISINWSRSRSTPRLRTGSDIVLSPEFAVSERSENLTRGFTVAPSLRRETKNWLWNLTFNRMSGSFSYRYNRSSNPFTKLDETRFYTGSLSYDLSPKKTLGFRPFGWLPSFWIFRKMQESQFSPLPATLNVSGDVSRTQRISVSNDLLQTRTLSYVRDFDGRLSSGFHLFPSLTADYSFHTQRDISNPDNLIFSFSPRRFRLGLELERDQSFRTSYNPGLFRFADTRLSFSSNYSEAGGLAASTDGARSINASSGYGVNVNFNLSRLTGLPKPPSGGELDRKTEKELEKKKKEEEKKRKEEEKKFGKGNLAPADSARAADSLARARARSDSLKAAAFDSIPVETRFRQQVERFLPIPVPALGFVIPKLGPPPVKVESVKNAQAADTSSPAARRDSPAQASRADSSLRQAALPDSAKKPAAGVQAAKKGSGEVFLLSGGLNLFRQLAARVDPVQFTYNRAKSITRRGLSNRPSLAFQFGLTDKLSETGVESASDVKRKSDSYTVGTGFNLGSGIRMNSRYAKNIARGEISSGTTRQEAETFPDLTLTVSGLEQRVGILKKFLPAGSLSSNYQRQNATTFDVATGRPSTISTAKNYNPLISVSATFFRGLSANFSLRKSVQTSKTPSGAENVFSVSETKENGFLFSTRYSFIAPNGIRLPLLRGIRLSSSLNTNLSLQYSHRVSRTPNLGSGSSGITTDLTNLGISPSMTYSFSTQVDGGLTIQWTDQKNNITKQTTKVRSAVFSVDLKF